MKQPAVVGVLVLLIGLWGTRCHSQAFSSSNLPIVVINTGGQTIADEPKVVVDLGIIYNGPGVRNNLTDPLNHYNGKAGIEIRGSSSQSFPKKQYGIELRDTAGGDLEVSLLGMPQEADWILFAPYNDKSLMRDALAYKLGRDQGRYASRAKYCELVLNGQYMGIYVLLEKAKRGKDRVNIDKLSPSETTGDNLTGGYLLKIDKFTGSNSGGWNSPYPPDFRNGGQTIYFQYEYPKGEDIVAQQEEYIRNYVGSFEAALNGVNFDDPAEGYAKYIDVESFVDYFIMNEVTKNVDGYRLSTFFYKKKDSEGGKLHMGPVWDFNLGFGNANYCTTGTTSGFVTAFNSICPGDFWLIPFWWRRLFQDKAFGEHVAARWLALRNGPFETSKVLGYVDSVAAVLNGESRQRNFAKWPVLGQYVWPNYYVGATFQDEVSWLRIWITQRMTWLDANIPGLVTGHEVTSPSSKFQVQASPNPFGRAIQFHYVIGEAGPVTIELFDGLGRSVGAMVREHGKPGNFETIYDQLDYSPGMYYYRAMHNGTSLKTGQLIRE